MEQNDYMITHIMGQYISRNLWPPSYTQRNPQEGHVRLLLLKYGTRPSSITTTWVLVRNVDSWTLLWIY